MNLYEFFNHKSYYTKINNPKADLPGILIAKSVSIFSQNLEEIYHFGF